MDEEFESLVVTDPDLVDEGIDISGLRTQTDVSPYLLGNIPDYAGIQYEAFNPKRLSELMRLYGSGLPAIDTSAAAPPATGGGGSGDGGQGTIPTDDYNKQEFEQNLIDEGIGVQIAPDQPVVAPGERPVTNLEMAIYNDPMLGIVDVGGEGEFGGLTGGVDPDRIQANEFAGLGVNEDLIDRGNPFGDPRIVSEEQGLVGGIPDRGRGQIPVDTRVRQDFTRPTIADITGEVDENLIDRGNPLGDRRIVSEEQGLIGGITDRGRGQIPTTDEFDVTTDQFTRPTMLDMAGPTDFTGAPITMQQTVMDGQPIDPRYDIEAIPITIDAPPSITLAKNPKGVVDPFGGKYTMSTSITPEDTEQSIKGKVADFLGVTEDQIDMAAVTGALNLMGGEILKTNIPIVSIVTKGFPIVKKGIDKVVDIFTGGDDKDTTPTTGVNPFADIDTGVGEFDITPTPTPTPTFTPRGGGADRDPDPAPSAPKGPSGPPSVISRPEPTFTSRGGGADRDPAPSRPSTPSQPDYSNVPSGKAPPSRGGDSGGPPSQGGGGCCFIMLEARYGDGTMDKVVRRYRDENMTPRNRRGYYKVAEVLVPLMRKSKIFKWIVTKTFADPLVSYGKWYYGENKHGWIFAPIKSAWLKLFDVVGTDTVFIRENGEEV